MAVDLGIAAESRDGELGEAQDDLAVEVDRRVDLPSIPPLTVTGPSARDTATPSMVNFGSNVVSGEPTPRPSTAMLRPPASSPASMRT